MYAFLTEPFLALLWLPVRSMFRPMHAQSSGWRDGKVVGKLS